MKFMFLGIFKETADRLPAEMRLKFYDALTDYVFKGVESDDPVVNAIITGFKPSLDKEEKRGGNHNPTGQNQYSKVKRGQNEVKRGQNNQSFQKIEEKEKINKKEKVSFLDVFDWKSLFTYWEENKKGGKYKNNESRERMLAKLKELTHNDFEFAKAAICHAIDNNYQGFCNGNELFYKPPKIRQGGYDDIYAECIKNGNEFLESFNNG